MLSRNCAKTIFAFEIQRNLQLVGWSHVLNYDFKNERRILWQQTSTASAVQRKEKQISDPSTADRRIFSERKTNSFPAQSLSMSNREKTKYCWVINLLLSGNKLLLHFVRPCREPSPRVAGMDLWRNNSFRMISQLVELIVYWRSSSFPSQRAWSWRWAFPANHRYVYSRDLNHFIPMPVIY